MPKRNILMIDDEIDFVEIMAKRMELWGYETKKAFTAKDGLEKLKDEKPDIIILDFMLPDMDGVATLKQIRKIDEKIPVIMFTAYPTVEAIKGTEKLGVIAFIPKLSIMADTQSALKAAIEMASR